MKALVSMIVLVLVLGCVGMWATGQSAPLVLEDLTCTASISVFGPIPANVAVCDPQRALAEYKAVQDQLTQLENDINAAKKQVISQMQAVAAKKKEIDGLKKRSERERAMKDLGTMEASLKAFQIVRGAELTKAKDSLKVSAEQDLSAAVAKIAKEKGANLVLSKQQTSVLYNDDSLDITGDVIAELNSEATE